MEETKASRGKDVAITFLLIICIATALYMVRQIDQLDTNDFFMPTPEELINPYEGIATL